MIQNYLKITLRNLWRNRLFSAISISGLSVSMACCLLMLIYLHDEWTFDHFNKNPEKVVRIVFDNYLDLGKFATTPLPVGPALKTEFPEVAAMTRVSKGLRSLVRNGENKYFENLAFVDTDLTDVFSMPFVSGDPRTALSQPNQLIISESYAKKFFGDQDPVGQTLVIGSTGSLNSVVTGVFTDFPQNSSIGFNIALPFSTFEKVYGPADLWQQMPGNYTFLRLGEHADAPALAAKLPDFTKKYMAGQLPEWEQQYQLALQPLTDIHLHSDYGRETMQGNLKSLYLLAFIALTVLAIAAFNYVNNATARFSKRAKEVGIRKVTGAGRGNLVLYSMTETLLTALLAGVFAVVFAELLLPWFNLLSGKNFDNGSLRQPMFYLSALGIVLAAGLGAGILPAVWLSGFRTVDVLKGKFSGMAKGQFSRKSLVVAQFTASTVLLIATLLVWQQMNFIRKNIRPESSEQVAVFQINNKIAGQLDALKQQLSGHPGILNISAGSNLPAFSGDSWPVQRDLNSTKVQTENYAVEDDFLETMGYELLAGRNLDKSLASDLTEAFLLNETAVKELGFKSPESALGQQLLFGGGANKKKGYVIGVVKDFYFESLHDKVQPALLQFPPYDWMTSEFVAVRFTPNQSDALRRTISGAVATLDPAWHVDLKFLDENFMQAHEKDIRQGQIFGAFAVLAIFISSLGLLGLSTFSAEQRVKEIGIRKVLGATTAGIVGLLSKDFLKLVLIALVIASPLAYFFMEKWLQDFAYRIEIQWWVFALAGVVAVGIAFLTVSFQSVKAALANPVKSLRSE